MARAYGQIMSAIWNDPQFRALRECEQRAYLMLVTQATISSAGVLALTVGRWSSYAADSTSDALWDALSGLAGKRFVVIDRSAEELLVRKFVKWDGGHTNEKRRLAITAAANAVVSPELRAVLAVELDALHVPHALSDAASDRASHDLSDKASDTPRVVVTESESGTTTQKPQPGTLEPAAQATAQKRGTRLPEHWTPSPETGQWTLQHLDSRTAARELEKFRNYWLAKTGRDATKLDWDRTWRNWILNTQDRASPTPAATTDGRVTAGLALAQRLAQQENTP